MLDSYENYKLRVILYYCDESSHTHTQGETKQIPMPRSMYNELHGHETTSTTFCTHNFLTIAMNSNNYLIELLGE